MTSVAVSWEKNWPAPQAASSSAGTTPHAVTNASRLASDVACNPSSQANTTKQTRMIARVTTGVRRVGFESRSGIMLAPPR